MSLVDVETSGRGESEDSSEATGAMMAVSVDVENSTERGSLGGVGANQEETVASTATKTPAINAMSASTIRRPVYHPKLRCFMWYNRRMDKELVCINVPETKIQRTPHTVEELRKGAKHTRASRIATEFERGFQFIKRFKKSVTIYGSARFKPSNTHYKEARALAGKLAKLGYTIVTGGGPGIMEAANRGAKEAGGISVGLNIELPHEQIVNPYVTESLSFFYFFSRKTALSFSAETYIFFPGGYGTLDEFFEIITLIQTRKIPKVPVILVGTDFWGPLHEFIKEEVYLRHSAIEKKDMDLYTMTDDQDEIIRIVTSAPVRP
jgi:uncharacterized protein (TIGR00730 family)